MAIAIRSAVKADAAACGRILYDAFAAIGDQHNFPHDFPSRAVAATVASLLIDDPGFLGWVAERDGRIVGSVFADRRAAVIGIGPISVDPTAQNQAIGRRLMQTVLDHATASDAIGVRLLQAAYHNRSFCLYSRLGFQVREPMSILQGSALDLKFQGYHVRPATVADIVACNVLCRSVHGFDRGHELADAIAQNSGSVVEHLGRITGYATGLGFSHHAVGASNQDLKALIGAASVFHGPGFILPSRNHDVLGWCLDHGIRLVMQMTLMTIGLYNEPSSAYLPSIQY